MKWFVLIYASIAIWMVMCTSHRHRLHSRQDGSLSVDQLRFVQETSRQMRNMDFEIIQKLSLVPLPPEDRAISEASLYLQKNNTMVVTAQAWPLLQTEDILCAQARLNATIDTIGWHKVHVRTYAECPPVVQMWAAGYLEGMLTHQHTWDFYSNLVHLHDNDKRSLQNVFDTFDTIENNIRRRVTNERLAQEQKVCDHVYWGNIALFQAQIDGMLQGHNAVSAYTMQVHDLYLVNSDGEVPELLQVFRNRHKQTLQARLKQQDNTSTTKINIKALLKKYKVQNGNELFLKKLMNSHCSAFIKLIINTDQSLNDVMIGHATWDDYSEMLRIYKHYSFDLLGQGDHGLSKHEVTFSSYPGCLSSTDDWYILSNGLVVTETTLEVMQESLYRDILDYHQYVPDFMRVMQANRMAQGGLSWVFWLSYYNTGTYNSQWMVLDLSLLDKSKGTATLLPNSFIVMEQMPGELNINFADMSEYLMHHQYWGSYNVPFFEQIRRVSGYTELMNTFSQGDSFSWDKNPRANLFRFYAPSIHTLQDMQWLMRLNQFDPQQSLYNMSMPALHFYDQNPGNAIAARFDLSPSLMFRKNVGAIDAKITNLAMAKRQACIAISGPTSQNQPPFLWSRAQGNDPHAGLPDSFSFPWLTIDPAFLQN